MPVEISVSRSTIVHKPEKASPGKRHQQEVIRVAHEASHGNPASRIQNGDDRLVARFVVVILQRPDGRVSGSHKPEFRETEFRPQPIHEHRIAD